MKKLVIAAMLGAVLVAAMIPTYADPPVSTYIGEILSLLKHPNFGLQEIKREVKDIEGKLDDPNSGLKEIKSEVNLIGFIVSDTKSNALAIKQVPFVAPAVVTIPTSVYEGCGISACARPPPITFALSCNVHFIVTSFRLFSTHDDNDDDFDTVHIGVKDVGGKFYDVIASVFDPGSNENMRLDAVSLIDGPLGVEGNGKFIVFFDEDANGADDTVEARALVLTTPNAVCSMVGSAP